MCVETYNGFPASVGTTDENSLHEVERLIMRLDNTYTLYKHEKEELMYIYKTARMLYLDSIFSDNDSIRNASSLYERYALEVMDKIAFIREKFSGNEIKNYHFYVDRIDCLSEVTSVILYDDTKIYNNLDEIDIQKDANGLCAGFLKLKELCLAAWQDIIRIQKYGLSINLSNGGKF